MNAQQPARGRSRALRVAAWNAALILGGLALIAITGEAWLRLTTPFIEPASPVRFVPGVGVLYEPHAEVRHTNDLDFWTAQRANSLGFLDREPPDPARAAASCHVAVIGDSYVAARQVEIADKLQVRLEALAAREAPQLGVTASAYGFPGTAQAGQLTSEEPELPPLAVRAEQLAARPGYGWILDGWRPADAEQGRWHYTLAGFGPLLSEEPPPVFAEALDFTAWSLAQFKRRADRDGAALAVLSSYSLGGPDSRWNVVLRGMADPLGIPVIDQREWIADRGRVEDARWPHDAHWTPQGHQWAAEAIFDWLRRHPEVCDD